MGIFDSVETTPIIRPDHDAPKRDVLDTLGCAHATCRSHRPTLMLPIDHHIASQQPHHSIKRAFLNQELS